MRLFSLFIAACVLGSVAAPASAQFFRPWYGYGYTNYYDGGGWPHGIYYRSRTNEVTYFLPPIYAPAEIAYGPQAMKQFMGVDRNFGLAPLADPSLLSDAALLRSAPPALSRTPRDEADSPALPRPSNYETRLMAAKFTAYGDARFREGKWAGALERWRTAAGLVPDVAEPRLRQVIVLIVLDRYDDAISALKAGLPLVHKPEDRAKPFTTLYADRGIGREQALEALARSAFAVADDAKPFVLLGYWFLAEGDLPRAKKFLAHAASLGGEHKEFAQSLLALTDGERH